MAHQKKRPGWPLEKIGWIGLLDQIQTLVEGSGTTMKAYNILSFYSSPKVKISKFLGLGLDDGGQRGSFGKF